MADIKQEHKPEDGENYAMANNTDPKNMQELTQFVSTVVESVELPFFHRRVGIFFIFFFYNILTM